MAKIPTLEEMLKAGLHFGHHASRWHPKMKPYIFIKRSGVHIFDLSKTQECLKIALDYIRKNIAENKVILFVGTKTQVQASVKDLGMATNLPYVSEKWLGGTLTNFAVIKKVVKKYKDLLEKKQGGKLDKYTKKERVAFDKDIVRLGTKVGGLVNLNNLPNAVFIWDVKKEKTVMAEAIKMGIPVIAVCDTNSNPTGINYIIPANDDASKGINLIFGLLKETIEEGKEEAKKAIKN
jgi:small subunit ribosomal protein S2